MKDDEDIIYLGAGPGAAILLGAALVPLRESTTASNLTYPFLLLIIVIAELGGWGPALATAVVSSLALNFFLTRPYLTLMIHGKDDVIAFLGLAACGLVVSAFAKQRGARLERARAGRRAP
jgi:two-component system, OmpR family, sensor histidine kinase KdpD